MSKLIQGPIQSLFSPRKTIATLIMKYLWSLTSFVAFWPDPPSGRSRAGQKEVTGPFKKILLQNGRLQQLTTALLRICEVGFKQCSVHRYSIVTMLHVIASCMHNHFI